MVSFWAHVNISYRTENLNKTWKVCTTAIKPRRWTDTVYGFLCRPGVQTSPVQWSLSGQCVCVCVCGDNTSSRRPATSRLSIAWAKVHFRRQFITYGALLQHQQSHEPHQSAEAPSCDDSEALLFDLGNVTARGQYTSLWCNQTVQTVVFLKWTASTHDADNRSTQPSTLRGTVKWVPAKGRRCSAAGE